MRINLFGHHVSIRFVCVHSCAMIVWRIAVAHVSLLLVRGTALQWDMARSQWYKTIARSLLMYNVVIFVSVILVLACMAAIDRMMLSWTLFRCSVVYIVCFVAPIILRNIHCGIRRFHVIIIDQVRFCNRRSTLFSSACNWNLACVTQPICCRLTEKAHHISTASRRSFFCLMD